ncbi:MAG: signal recognition particle-docking protein FtsY [Zestosphaera tikiterensis]|uniref:Signal recognition particle receptor FtsY n=1 Tax=Zestosphaera tikiterensis TaxID=1973259 RepID=A0A2R7Y770_9CREN|nr:MAG: signal recognition particle-docking protein FtsY [Zestosphaera tikiterensis]
MFKKVRETLRSLTSKVSDTLSKKELSYEEFNEIFEEFRWVLSENDVAQEAIDALKEILAKELVGVKISRFTSSKDYVVDKVKEALRKLLEENTFQNDLVDLVKASPKPYVIVFMGVNGVGKTTTIAKVAFKLKTNGLKPVIVAADTFRAGALEQLEIHAKKLDVPFIRGKYGADPASVAKDGVIYAQKNKLDVVLIDTAGRMHTDRDLMDEIRKVVRVVKPNLKVLVLDALVGNDAVNQAKWFDEVVGVDAVILTKLDADAKGGSALSVILTINKKIMYVGVGQGYEDLLKFNPDLILNNLLEQ